MTDTAIPETMITTTQAAERFGKDESHIRRLCKDNNIGAVKYGRIRLLNKSDIDRLEKYFEKFGRNRPKQVAGC